MSDGAATVSALRDDLVRWRRRVRAARALSGSEAGVGIGLGAACLMSLARVTSAELARAFAPEPWALGLLVGALGTVGAIAGAARRGPSLEACARAIDVAAGRPSDAIVVSAWDFERRATEAAPPLAGFVARAIESGRRAVAATPAAPLFGPRARVRAPALAALAVGAVVLARAPSAPTDSDAPALTAWRAPAALAPAVAEALRAAADRDPRLRPSLAAAAVAVAAAAERWHEASRRERADAPRVDLAREGARGDSAGASPTVSASPRHASAAGTRADAAAELARALERAAQQLAATSPQSAGEPRRQLERLRRDLDDAADACRADPAACARALEQLQRSLSAHEPPPAAPRSTDGREPRAREGGGSGGDARRSFERAASGGRGDEAKVAGAGRSSSPAAQRSAGSASASEAGGPGAGGGVAIASAKGAPGEASGVGASGDDGPPGRNAGGAPLGRRSGPTGGGFAAALPDERGDESDGPTRAELIATSAAGGFAAPAYRRTWTEYARAAEDLVESNSVPAHRRELVKRYFDLIRPRSRTP